MLRQHFGIFLGLGIVAIRRRTHGDEVQVVAVIHHRIDPLRSRCLDVRAIDSRRLLVGFHGRLVISRADVNMRRHVHDVSRSRRQ